MFSVKVFLSSPRLCWPNIPSEAVGEVPQDAGHGESEAGTRRLFFRPGEWRPDLHGENGDEDEAATGVAVPAKVTEEEEENERMSNRPLCTFSFPIGSRSMLRGDIFHLRIWKLRLSEVKGLGRSRDLSLG